MEENLERKLLNRGRAFATFSTIEKALAGRMLCRPLYKMCNTVQLSYDHHKRANSKAGNSSRYKGKIPLKRERFRIVIIQMSCRRGVGLNFRAWDLNKNLPKTLTEVIFMKFSYFGLVLQMNLIFCL